MHGNIRYFPQKQPQLTISNNQTYNINQMNPQRHTPNRYT